jgi:hypothetical protein
MTGQGTAGKEIYGAEGVQGAAVGAQGLLHGGVAASGVRGVLP